MVIDRTQLDRQFAIVDLIKELPTAIAWAAISELPLAQQNQLYDFLHRMEDRPPTERTPYPWCIGNPAKQDCIAAGYCRRDPNCGN